MTHHEPQGQPVSIAEVLARAAAMPEPNRPHFIGGTPDETRLGDRILYRAQRDIRPSFVAYGVTWRIDRVAYVGDDLPSGELNRSVGHWNPADQHEVFVVDSGTVLIVTAGDAAGHADGVVTVSVCTAGSVIDIAPGSWHLTYAAGNDCVVTNIYSQPRRRHGDKYFTKAPVRVGVQRTDHGYRAVASEARPVDWVDTMPTLSDLVPDVPSLASIFEQPDRRTERLAALVRDLPDVAGGIGEGR